MEYRTYLLLKRGDGTHVTGSRSSGSASVPGCLSGAHSLPSSAPGAKVAHAGTKWMPKPRRGAEADAFGPLPCHVRPSCRLAPPARRCAIDTMRPSMAAGSTPSRCAAERSSARWSGSKKWAAVPG